MSPERHTVHLTHITDECRTSCVTTEQLKLLSSSQYLGDGAESLMYLPEESTQPKPTRNLPNRYTEKAQSHSYSVTEKKNPKKLQFSKPCMFFWSSYFIVKIFFLFIRPFQVLTHNFFSWSAFFHLKAWFSFFSFACNYNVIKTTVPSWINLTYKRHCSILHSIYLQELHMQEMTCKYNKQMDLFLFSLIIWADCSFVRITVMHNELLNNSPVHPDVSGSWAKTF